MISIKEFKLTPVFARRTNAISAAVSWTLGWNGNQQTTPSLSNVLVMVTRLAKR
jgi:hypothetical protein